MLCRIDVVSYSLHLIQLALKGFCLFFELCFRKLCSTEILNIRIGDVMVKMASLSVVDCGFEPPSS